MSEKCPPSISTAEKPTKHVSVQDWKKNVNNLQNIAENERDQAILLRNEVRLNRNEAGIASNWARHKTNVQLADRISEEQQWIQVLECSRRVLDDTSNQLGEEKSVCELQIEAYYRAIAVVSECLHVRDRRPALDLTYDNTHAELQSEHKLLEGSKEDLTEKCTAAWELIKNANELSTNLRDNIKDKVSTLHIDCNTLELNPDSPLVGYKPDATKIRSEIVDKESWLQTAQAMQTDADTLTTQMVRHSEAMRLKREKINVMYLTQVESTNYALRKRIFTANKLKNELVWQRQNTEEEMSKVQGEIDELRESEKEHEKLLQCAETRQEDRNIRPAMELVRDFPHEALLDEIVKLRTALRAIRENIAKAMCTYNQLEELRNRLRAETESKETCIQLEMRTLDCRSNLLQHEPLAGVDKDSVLIKMEKQISPSLLC